MLYLMGEKKFMTFHFIMSIYILGEVIFDYSHLSVISDAKWAHHQWVKGMAFLTWWVEILSVFLLLWLLYLKGGEPYILTRNTE